MNLYILDMLTLQKQVRDGGIFLMKLCRRLASEGFEITDKVRLIVITIIEADARKIGWIFFHLMQCSVKPYHSGKIFWIISGIF